VNYIYITGTGSGIGKALANLLVKNPDNRVIGISRHQKINHPQYLHISFDLSDMDKLSKFRFENIKHADKIIMVNNAATLGEVKYAGNLHNRNIIKSMQLNLIAPAVLTNQFIHAYKEIQADKLILNISSGAGQYPVDGWSIYCSTKAGLDMLTKTVELEQLKEHEAHRFKTFSIAPGIVNTPMQTKIRKMNSDNFSRVEEFRDYYETGVLAEPDDIAVKLANVINRSDEYTDTVFRLVD
jgi:benzil reductase ((S)-benzoin forming)